MRARFDRFELDLTQGLLRHAEGEEIHLRPRTLEVLRILVREAPQVVAHDALLDRVWGTEHVSAGVVAQAISELRQALGDSSRGSRVIDTVHRRGYRLIAPIELEAGEAPGASPEATRHATGGATSDGPATTPDSIAPPPTTTPSDPPLGSSPSNPPGTRPPTLERPQDSEANRSVPALLLGASALVVGLLLAVGWIASRGGAPDPTAASATVAATSRLAVLDFEDLAPRPESAWLATALADLLTEELTNKASARVLDRQRVARALRERRGAETSGRPLGAHWATVAGSYQLEPSGTLRVYLRAPDAEPDGQPIRIALEGSSDEVQDLAARLGDALVLRLGPRADGDTDLLTPGRRLPTVPSYYAGIQALRADDPRRAQTLLEQALAEDESNPQIHQALARSLDALGLETEARAAAERAVELGAGLGRRWRLELEALARSLAGSPEAVDLYRSLATFFPDDLDYRLELARAELRAGMPERALNTLDELDALPDPERGDPRIDLIRAQGLALLSRLEDQLAAATRASVTARERDLPLLLGDALLERGQALQSLGRLDEAGEAYGESRRLYARAGERWHLAEAIGRLGELDLIRGHLNSSIGLLEEAVSLNRRLGNRRRLALWLHRLGVADLQRGSTATAAETLREASRLYGATGQVSGEAKAEAQLGLLLFRQGNLEDAAERFIASREVFRQLGDRRAEAGASINLANAWARMGSEPARAEEAYKEALSLLEGIGDVPSQALTLSNLGALLVGFARYDEARDHYRRALELYRQVGDRNGETRILINLASEDERRGDLTGCRGNLEDALEIALDVGDRRLQATSVERLGRLALIQGRTSEAQRLIDDALALHKASEDRLREAASLELSGQIAYQRGRTGAALAAFGEALALYQSLGASQRAAYGRARLTWPNVDRWDAAEAAKAERDLRTSLAALEPGGERRYRPSILLEIALSQLEQGLVAPALETLKEARSILEPHADWSMAIQLDILDARAQAPRAGWAESVERLREIARRSDEKGFIVLGLEARLAAARLLPPTEAAAREAELAILRDRADVLGLARYRQLADRLALSQPGASSDS